MFYIYNNELLYEKQNNTIYHHVYVQSSKYIWFVHKYLQKWSLHW